MNNKDKDKPKKKDTPCVQCGCIDGHAVTCRSNADFPLAKGECANCGMVGEHYPKCVNDPKTK